MLCKYLCVLCFGIFDLFCWNFFHEKFKKKIRNKICIDEQFHTLFNSIIGFGSGSDVRVIKLLGYFWMAMIDLFLPWLTNGSQKNNFVHLFLKSRSKQLALNAQRIQFSNTSTSKFVLCCLSLLLRNNISNTFAQQCHFHIYFANCASKLIALISKLNHDRIHIHFLAKLN